MKNGSTDLFSVLGIPNSSSLQTTACWSDLLLCSILISCSQPFIRLTRRRIGHHLCSPRGHGRNCTNAVVGTACLVWFREQNLQPAHQIWAVWSRGGCWKEGCPSKHWEQTLGKKNPKNMWPAWPRPQTSPRQQTGKNACASNCRW